MAQPELSLLDAFKQRHSVRSFNTNEFKPEDEEFIQKTIEEANALDVPFHTVSTVGLHPAGLGRIGVISGENGWLLPKIPKDTAQENLRKAIIDVSFRLHYCVMQLTKHHISTVWIAGTYSRSTAESDNPGFLCPAGIPYGIEGGTRFLERAMKWFSGSKDRYPLEKIFNTVPSGKEEFCEALRSGPSAINKQPWRFVFSEDNTEIHLFDSSNNDYSQFDMGIALMNIYLLVKNSGHEPQFTVKDPPPQPFSSGDVYVISCTL